MFYLNSVYILKETEQDKLKEDLPKGGEVWAF